MPTRRGLVRGLTEAEVARAEQVARRLHSELRGVVASLPEVDRAASAMSRALELDRATCQRIVAAVTRPSAGATLLVQVPGVQGLRQFISAVASRGTASAESLAATRAAIDQFETLIDELAGSQRRLRERMALTAGADDGENLRSGAGVESLSSRERLFQVAAEITGRWSETSVYMRIIRPVPGQPDRTELLVVRGLIGHEWQPQAVPLLVGAEATLQTGQAIDAGDVGGAGGEGGGEGGFATLDAKPASGATPSSLVRPFCSSPLPRVVSRAAGTRVVQMLDTDAAPERPADIVIANRHGPDEHPAAQNPPVGEIWALITFPSRALLFDTYLHKDIARRCIPSLELHLWEPDVGRQGPMRWVTQFPTRSAAGGPRLEVLGTGVSRVASPAYERMPDLTRHLFEQVGWDGDEFVGYRCEAMYPVWRAGYCMAFDFTGNEVR